MSVCCVMNSVIVDVRCSCHFFKQTPLWKGRFSQTLLHLQTWMESPQFPHLKVFFGVLVFIWSVSCWVGIVWCTHRLVDPAGEEHWIVRRSRVVLLQSWCHSQWSASVYSRAIERVKEREMQHFFYCVCDHFLNNWLKFIIQRWTSILFSASAESYALKIYEVQSSFLNS